jgi:hypothetical protein
MADETTDTTHKVSDLSLYPVAKAIKEEMQPQDQWKGVNLQIDYNPPDAAPYISWVIQKPESARIYEIKEVTEKISHGFFKKHIEEKKHLQEGKTFLKLIRDYDDTEHKPFIRICYHHDRSLQDIVTRHVKTFADREGIETIITRDIA